jgi:AMMECR1 domain-containing protein
MQVVSLSVNEESAADADKQLTTHAFAFVTKGTSKAERQNIRGPLGIYSFEPTGHLLMHNAIEFAERAAAGRKEGQ